MTLSTTNKPNWTVALGIPFSIFVLCLLITFSSKFGADSKLVSNAILADLLITAPLAYFLAIRKSNVSKLTVVRVFIAGLAVAGLILQPHLNPILPFIKTRILPVIEAFVIFITFRKIHKIYRQTKKTNGTNADFLWHCQSVLFDIFGNATFANIIASELSVIYYAFFNIGNKPADYKTTFTSYKENGLPAVLSALLFILLIETTCMHFVLRFWSQTLAWVLTGLSFYTCIQLFAHLRALRARPIIINSGSIDVRHGLAGDAFIRFENVEKVELSNKKPIDRQYVNISLFRGPENHNIVVYLKSAMEVTIIFGIKKQTDTVLFFVDKPKDFINAVTTCLTDNGR